MATTKRVDVPKEVGDEITISYDGNEPVTYKVRDGHVAVDTEYVERFLAVIEGSKASTGNTGASDKGES